MKILFVITGLFPGGAERIVLELGRNFTEKGHQCTVVSLMKRPCDGEDTIVKALEKLPCKLIFLETGLLHPLRFFSLRRIVQEEKPDVIHGHLMHGNLASRFAAWGKKIPVINTVHIAEKRAALKVKILFLLDHLTRKKCTVYTAVSASAARFHEKRCRLKEKEIRVIYNGSDPVKKASPEQLELFRSTYGLEQMNKIIGSVGRLDFQKGYDIFFRTLPDLHKLIPEGENWGILIMGDGPEREKLEVLAKEMSVKCPRLKIVLTGYLPDAASHLSLLDLFVMPSRYEGYGLTLAEAVSCGVPCLCSPADSLPELCALVPENTFCMDFVPGEMVPVYEKALSLPRREGRILCDCNTMAENYLRLYREVREK